MDKKFELIENDTKELFGTKLYRIRSLQNFSYNGYSVKRGDLGGYVEKEENLSQNGFSWIFDSSEAFEDSRVYQNAMLLDKSSIHENARAYGNASIYKSELRDNSQVHGDCLLRNAFIENNAEIYGSMIITIGQFGKDAIITSSKDYIYFSLEGGEATFYKTAAGKINLTYYFNSELEFNGSIKQFKKLLEESPDLFNVDRAKRLIRFSKEQFKDN